MKQFVVGLALLMLVWSLPSGTTNNHVAVNPQPIAGVQKAAFEQFFGDTLPPMGYVQFCELHKSDCRPSGPFADRIQLTDRKFAELKQVNDQVNTTVVPMSDLEHSSRNPQGRRWATHHGRAHLVGIKALKGGLMLSILRYADEIRDFTPYCEGINIEVKPEAVGLAKELIEAESGRFEPEKIPDKYAETLRELLQAKIEQRAPQIEVALRARQSPKFPFPVRDCWD